MDKVDPLWAVKVQSMLGGTRPFTDLPKVDKAAMLSWMINDRENYAGSSLYGFYGGLIQRIAGGEFDADPASA